MSESTENLQVMEFFAIVLQDETLREEFMTALDAKDNKAILAMASNRGYNFSLQSLQEELKNILNLVAPIAILENDE